MIRKKSKLYFFVDISRRAGRAGAALKEFRLSRQKTKSCHKDRRQSDKVTHSGHVNYQRMLEEDKVQRGPKSCVLSRTLGSLPPLLACGELRLVII